MADPLLERLARAVLDDHDAEAPAALISELLRRGRAPRFAHHRVHLPIPDRPDRG